MKAQNPGLNFENAVFPAIMTGFSFIAFLVVYWIVTQGFVEPYYWAGILFAVPFVTFGILTYCAAKGSIGTSLSAIITSSLTVSFGILAVALLVILLIASSTTTSTDVKRYEKALSQMGYPNILTKDFPREIPDNAENVAFTYHPAFGQGGEQLTLKFKTDEDSVHLYKEYFTKTAVWFGSFGDKERESHGVFDGKLNAFRDGHNELPSDLVIYVVFSEPHRPGDWNHGELSLVAISEGNLEIMFLAEGW